MPVNTGRAYGVWQGNVPFQPGDYALTSFVDALTAHAGGGQSSALPLTGQTVRVSTVATAGDSVALPPSTPGMQIAVVNAGANNMQVYGAGTDTINGIATATGVIQAPNSTTTYFCAATGAWYSDGPSNAFSPTAGFSFSPYATIAANSGAAQSGATPLTATINMVTSAGSAYSVLLPVSVPGMYLDVYTTTATNTVAVFPNAGGTTTEVINALAANAGITMATRTSARFACAVAGQWYTLPRVPS
jgi:hypothetical protein